MNTVMKPRLNIAHILNTKEANTANCTNNMHKSVYGGKCGYESSVSCDYNTSYVRAF